MTPAANPLKKAAQRLFSDNLTLSCAIVLACIALSCAFANLICPEGYRAQDLQLGISAPSMAHIFGTDSLGRDVFARVLYGGRVSFAVGVLATFVAVVIGVAYGTASAMAGGRIDAFMMRVVDVIYTLPFTIFVILLMVAFGRSLWLIFVAIGAVEWLTMARIARASALEVKSRQFVEAAKVLGQSRTGILFRHILPNMLTPIFACAALTVPSVMMLEAFLSFLGLGVQAPLPSWGSLIKDGAELMEDAPWLLVFPTLFFSVSLFCLNRIGEALSEDAGK